MSSMFFSEAIDDVLAWWIMEFHLSSEISYKKLCLVSGDFSPGTDIPESHIVLPEFLLFLKDIIKHFSVFAEIKTLYSPNITS